MRNFISFMTPHKVNSLAFFFDFQAVGCRHGERDTGGLEGTTRTCGQQKLIEKSKANLRGFQDSGNSKFLRVLAALFFFLKNQRQGFLCYFRSSTAKFWDIPSTWGELCWKLVENSVLHCMIPFFSPHIHRIKKYQNPSKKNKSINSIPKTSPKAEWPGAFFFCFVFKQWMPGILKLDTPLHSFLSTTKREKKTEKQKSIQMQWCPSLLHSIFNRFF